MFNKVTNEMEEMAGNVPKVLLEKNFLHAAFLISNDFETIIINQNWKN